MFAVHLADTADQFCAWPPVNAGRETTQLIGTGGRSRGQTPAQTRKERKLALYPVISDMGAGSVPCTM